MRSFFLSVFLLCVLISRGQLTIKDGPIKAGFMYSPGVMWEMNERDSVTRIHITGDTLTAIKNLLIYCLQEKKENDNAAGLLSIINLDQFKKTYNYRPFNFYLAEYRKAVASNKKYRQKHFPETKITMYKPN